MSYYKKFIAASSALAAATIRDFKDLPPHVAAFAAGEVEKLKHSPDYVLQVELSGHSPTGASLWESAAITMSTQWVAVVGLEPIRAPEPDEQPTERIVQAARPLDPGFESGKPSGEDDGA